MSAAETRRADCRATGLSIECRATTKDVMINDNAATPELAITRTISPEPLSRRPGMPFPGHDCVDDVCDLEN